MTQRVALVTGGGGGIGTAICRVLASDGMAVAVADSDAERARSAAAAVESEGGSALAIEVDVSSRDSVEQAVAAVGERFGGLDVVVNNAAIYPRRAWTEITEEEWDRVFAVNLKGYFLTARAAHALLERGGSGRIVNVSSITWLVGITHLLDYVSTKAGIVGFTRALAKELGPSGITVNAVAPGAIPTDAEKIHPDQEAYTRSILEQQALQRRATPEDVAHAVAFLAGDRASFITGQTLVVDGGWALH